MRSFNRQLEFRSRTRNFIPTAITLSLLLLLSGCDPHGPSIEMLRAGGELRVALVSAPHTYYLDPGGTLGFDYDLLRAFCKKHELKLDVTIVKNRLQAKDLLIKRKVHLAAGLIPVSASHHPRLRFGPSYSMIQAQVIYIRDSQRPSSVNDLIGVNLETLAGSQGDIELSRLVKANRSLRWQTSNAATADQLLERLDTREIDFAVVPSTDFKVLRLKYPRLEIGFSLGPTQATAWVLQRDAHFSVDRALVDFFVDSENGGLRQRLWDRYFGHYDKFDFVDARSFLRSYRDRFPTLREYFLDASTTSGIDWRLLAALSYQESHWRPEARSPTGVRGLMMLTTRTANRLQVSRLDPAQAVTGGARYLEDLFQRLPRSIMGNERLWFALAAYNLGMGHVEDARVLTQTRGGNPSHWDEVRRYLPLLAKPTVAATTRYGKARGAEAVKFVTNIRRYFDTMRQLERRFSSPKNPNQVFKVRTPSVL